MIPAKENRATTRHKDLIARDASTVNKTISEFVWENAVAAAEALEMDKANLSAAVKNMSRFWPPWMNNRNPFPSFSKYFRKNLMEAKPLDKHFVPTSDDR